MELGIGPQLLAAGERRRPAESRRHPADTGPQLDELRVSPEHVVAALVGRVHGLIKFLQVAGLDALRPGVRAVPLLLAEAPRWPGWYLAGTGASDGKVPQQAKRPERGVGRACSRRADERVALERGLAAALGPAALALSRALPRPGHLALDLVVPLLDHPRRDLAQGAVEPV